MLKYQNTLAVQGRPSYGLEPKSRNYTATSSYKTTSNTKTTKSVINPSYGLKSSVISNGAPIVMTADPIINAKKNERMFNQTVALNQQKAQLFSLI